MPALTATRSRRRGSARPRRSPAPAFSRALRRNLVAAAPWLLLAVGLLLVSIAFRSPVPSKEVEARVRREFRDAPVMVRIAWCESRFRQHDSDGSVLRGKVNPRDRGVFQINEPWHLETANRLGFDIYSLDGNIGYARHLYERRGTADWKWSRPCWGPKKKSNSKLAAAR